jgi:hypothetical protein
MHTKFHKNLFRLSKVKKEGYIDRKEIAEVCFKKAG